MMKNCASLALASCILLGCATQPGKTNVVIPKDMRFQGAAALSDGSYKFGVYINQGTTTWLGHTRQRDFFGFSIRGYDPVHEVLTLERKGRVIELPKGRTVSWEEPE